VGSAPQEQSLQFGNLAIGTTEVLPLTIKNVGVAGSPTVMFGFGNPSYTVLPGSSCVTVGVSAGNTCTVQVQFAPVTVGGHNHNLTVIPSVGATSTVKLLGSASAP
jgi:hypothetical protein